VNKFQRFRKLPAAQKNNLLWAATLLPTTGAALRLLGFHRWKSLLAIAIPRKTPAGKVTSEVLMEAGETARMVAAAAREGLFRARCLEKSMVLWFLLARKRVPAELRIGVRQSATGLEAHAWVEVQGTIVNDTEDIRHTYMAFSENVASLGAEQR
jgi:hypothetical protein